MRSPLHTNEHQTAGPTGQELSVMSFCLLQTPSSVICIYDQSAPPFGLDGAFWFYLSVITMVVHICSLSVV